MVCTTSNIKEFNKRNVDMQNISSGDNGDNDEDDNNQSGSNKNNLQDFPAYKLKPVLIAGFLNEATIMLSKEKPKKIGIIGSNK